MYRIATYTICKNEIEHVDKWFNSVKQADEIYILDTGSTDGTLEKLKDLQKENKNFHLYEKHYEIFSFGDAWNTILEKIPEDIDFVFRIDMDQWIENHYWKFELNLCLMHVNANPKVSTVIQVGLFEKNFRRIELHGLITSSNVRWAGDIHERIYFPGVPQYEAIFHDFPIYLFHNQKYPSTGGTKIEGCQKRFDFYKFLADEQYYKNPTVFNLLHYLMVNPAMNVSVSELIKYLVPYKKFNTQDSLETYDVDYDPQIIDVLTALVGLMITIKSFSNFISHEGEKPLNKKVTYYPYFSKVLDMFANGLLSNNSDTPTLFGFSDCKEVIKKYTEELLYWINEFNKACEI